MEVDRSDQELDVEIRVNRRDRVASAPSAKPLWRRVWLDPAGTYPTNPAAGYFRSFSIQMPFYPSFASTMTPLSYWMAIYVVFGDLPVGLVARYYRDYS